MLVKPDTMVKAIVSWQLTCPVIESGSLHSLACPCVPAGGEEMTAGHLLKLKMEFIRNYCY